MPIRVLIVDDSALIREMLSVLLAKDSELLVVGTAEDPYDAREKIRTLTPDVITLDIEMPNMNGIAFLERLMRLRPIPVVMVSTLTQKGADVTLLALELGAVDFVAKPVEGGEDAWNLFGTELREKVRTAAEALPIARTAAGRPTRASDASPIAPHPRALVAIGASTGGVEALRGILAELPSGMPPLVIAQHMPAGFTARFAQRLDEACGLNVREATHGLPLDRGMVAIAPGNRHLRIVHSAGFYECSIDDGDPVSGHRPSVDVLFRSVASAAGRHAVGVILTGMGKDGARGLLELHEAGARTIGQNEATSLVYGMPRAARDIGAVQTEVPLEGIATRIVADVAAHGAKAA